jgi:Holliday junction resolvase
VSSTQSQKGSRFEYKIRDMLSEKTGVKWDRVPQSGGGVIKGDLFCVANHYFHCIECKSFKDTVIQENLLTAKSNNIYMWWEQTTREAKQMNRVPALVFKKDRAKPLIMIEEKIEGLTFMFLNSDLGPTSVKAYIYLFEDWLANKKIEELVIV